MDMIQIRQVLLLIMMMLYKSLLILASCHCKIKILFIQRMRATNAQSYYIAIKEFVKYHMQVVIEKEYAFNYS